MSASKCVQFCEICLLQCSTIINAFWVDPHSKLLKKVPVKPKNERNQMNEVRLFLELFSRLLLRHCFESLRSTQVAMVHCSAQTSPVHVLQKLQQTCMVISSNTGRVYRPKDCERLILYLKDINLPKPDKWGTSQLIAFIQQVCMHHDA